MGDFIEELHRNVETVADHNSIKDPESSVTAPVLSYQVDDLPGREDQTY
jgi:hypothetical protein